MHSRWTKLDWSDLQPWSRPSYTARSLVTRVSVTTWLATAKLGRLVLSQFESNRVSTFVIGVEHAVQSQQRRTMVHDTPIAALSSAGTGGYWAGAWMKQATVLVIRGLLIVDSRYAAKLRWPVDVRIQGCTRRAPETAERDWRRPSVDAAGTQRSAR